jgi:hypothetical protein
MVIASYALKLIEKRFLARAPRLPRADGDSLSVVASGLLAQDPDNLLFRGP